MNSGPNLASIASLIGERARADMLSALMSGRALTATELAETAGISKQTASSHLSKLLQRRLVVQEKQGRHRYFRLADDDVAEVLEGLMSVAQKVGATRLQTGPSEPALRAARVCYDHLAGEAGVALFEALRYRGWITVIGTGADITADGYQRLESLGINAKTLLRGRRPLCRLCLDWSVRRHHLAGTLGAALLELLFERRWAKREKQSRVVTVTPSGARALRMQFGIRLSHI